MRKAALVMLFIVSASLENRSLAAQTVTDSVQLRQLTSAWNEAHMRGDASALADLWHRDLTVLVPGMTSMGREAVLAIVRSGRVTFSRYETTDVIYRIYEGAAIEEGNLTRHRRRGGETVIDTWRYSKVYVRTPSGWKVTSFHASEAVMNP